MKFVAFMRALITASLLHVASAGELGKILGSITKFDPLVPAAHETHINVGVYFEMLHKVDDVAHTFDAEFTLVYQWHDPRNYSELFHHEELLENEAVTCVADSGAAQGGHRRLGGDGAGSSGGAGVEAFVEFGEDEMDYVWRPDLQVTNVHSGLKELNKMMRFYDDGTIEYVQLTYARLKRLEVRFDAYPFDAHRFGINIESRSHTVARIVLEQLDDMTGIEEELAKQWPAWTYDSIHSHVEERKPNYIHKNPCRTEKRSRYVFVVEATRTDTFLESTFVPSLLLVITSFVGPYLNLNALMPRIATGFISFLTLTTLMSSQLSVLPKITYPVWFIIFMNTQRYYVFSALMETAFAHIIQDRLSTRTAMALDNYTRIALPLSYMIMMSYLYSNAPQSEGAEDLLIFMKNAVSAMFVMKFLLGAVWVAYYYRRIKFLLRNEPMEVHKSTPVHLDKNEVSMLFHFIDIDGGKQLDMSEVVVMMLGLGDIIAADITEAESVTVSRDDCPPEVIEMIKILEGKFGKVLNKESFFTAHRAIFSEVDIFCTKHPEIEKLWGDHTARVKGSIDRGSFEQRNPSPPASPSQISPQEKRDAVQERSDEV
jgi:hypothetical protein